MKQLISSFRTGEMSVEEVPVPAPMKGSLLVESRVSLISAGTERMLLDFGRANWIKKAQQQPDKVKEVLNKVKTDGIVSTVESVQSKLDDPVALGYCNAGVVREVGEGVDGFTLGERVVSNGPHAEIVGVPKNLCARIPDGVDFEEAVYTVPAAIALQGIRLAQPTLGEAFTVTGLGLIGQLTVQLLVANGCRVLGIDPDSRRRQLAADAGAETADPGSEDVLAVADRFSRSLGIDGVIITAATQSNEPVSQAARMSRKRGRIVLVGVAGLSLNRSEFFEKELTFQVSCSYGPGRYDPEYEQKGHDYPAGFVRWTEQRNFEAVLDSMASGALDVSALTTHRFPIEKAPEAYEVLAGGEPYLGIVLEYPQDASYRHHTDRVVNLVPADTGPAGEPVVAFIGAGSYAGRVLMPAFKKGGAVLRSVTATSGLRPAHYGRRFGFQQAGTDVETALRDDSVNTVAIATRHDSHADLVGRALESGRHVFVEKPLALTMEELDHIEQLYRSLRGQGKAPVLAVGFNRRFAPLTRQAGELLAAVEAPRAFVVTVNAGAVPKDHWTRDEATGGGRIIGEACHFIDLIRGLARSRIVDTSTHSVADVSGTGDAIASLHLGFEDGSIGTVHYLSNGHKSFPKERVEIFTGGRVLRIDNFRVLRGWGWPGFRGRRLFRQDKGQEDCVRSFLECVASGKGEGPIPFEELLEVSRATISLASGME